MKKRVYVRKHSAQKRLEKAGILQQVMPEEPWKYSWGPFVADDSSDSLVYYQSKSLIGEPPVLAKGLKVVKVSLHAKLAAEQNQHLKQGCGKEGQASWEVEFGAEKFEAPTASPSSYNANAFRSIVTILVRSEKLKSAQDCYKKIREGELGGNWKGAPAAIVATSMMEI